MKYRFYRLEDPYASTKLFDESPKSVGSLLLPLAPDVPVLVEPVLEVAHRMQARQEGITVAVILDSVNDLPGASFAIAIQQRPSDGCLAVPNVGEEFPEAASEAAFDEPEVLGRGCCQTELPVKQARHPTGFRIDDRVVEGLIDTGDDSVVVVSQVAKFFGEGGPDPPR